MHPENRIYLRQKPLSACAHVEVFGVVMPEVQLDAPGLEEVPSEKSSKDRSLSPYLDELAPNIILTTALNTRI